MLVFNRLKPKWLDDCISILNMHMQFKYSLMKWSCFHRKNMGMLTPSKRTAICSVVFFFLLKMFYELRTCI